MFRHPHAQPLSARLLSKWRTGAAQMAARTLWAAFCVVTADCRRVGMTFPCRGSVEGMRQAGRATCEPGGCELVLDA